MKPVLFVRCDRVDTFGIAPSAVEDAGAEVRIWEAIDGIDAPSLDGIGGLIVFGSTYNVEHADEAPFIKLVRDITREAIDRRIPFLGSCFGAQLLAWTLDAEVTKAPMREVGFEPIHPTDEGSADPLVGVWDDGDQGFQWHMDTFELPAGAVLLATGDRVRHQAFRFGDRTWGIQWHFEIDAAEAELWLREFGQAGGDIERDWGKTNAQVRDEVARYMYAHERKGRETFARFVNEVRAAG
ncbi:MAG TPA: type 1 glutamine amidotransferase [Actinomycetota bacterium]|nr:type 1 glutamine amidotransferase [Actinomycetota bacterium]